MKNELSRGDEIYGDEVFKVLLGYEVSRSERYPAPLSMLHIEMTPTGLHEADLMTASRIFTTALNAHLRSVDIPCGAGREFKVLLPTTNEAGLRSVCERILSVFRNKFTTPDGKSIAFSLNIGAVSHNGGGLISPTTLLEKAETALKHSKHKGPNVYIIYS